ncbi:MAG: uridine kinase [Bacillota bacterium]
MSRPVVIGIAGGSGSGKTTVARAILEALGESNIVVLEHDSYYKAQDHLTFEQRVKTNYDHPLAFDTELLIEHIKQLMDGKTIAKPIYDFSVHTRKPDERVTVEPRDIIIIEGFLIYEDQRLRDLMDIKLFVDTDADVRIVRRIMRDIRDRGRTVESVVHQYLDVVRPMHMQFVEPTKRYADVIIPEGGHNTVAIDMVITKVKSIIEEKSEQRRKNGNGH